MDTGDLDRLIGDIDAQIRAEEEGMVKSFRAAQDRVATLVLRRRRLKEMLSEMMGAAATVASPAQDTRQAETGVPGPISAAILRHLHAERAKGGVAGGDLKRIIAEQTGKNPDSISKQLTRMKKPERGLVRRDEASGLWGLTPRGAAVLKSGEAVAD